MVDQAQLARMSLDELANHGGNVTLGSVNAMAVTVEFLRRQTAAQERATAATSRAAWAAVVAAGAGALAAVAALIQTTE